MKYGLGDTLFFTAYHTLIYPRCRLLRCILVPTSTALRITSLEKNDRFSWLLLNKPHQLQKGNDGSAEQTEYCFISQYLVGVYLMFIHEFPDFTMFSQARVYSGMKMLF